MASNALFSQNLSNYLKYGKGEKYRNEWSKVDSLERYGLPKSALEIIEQIYQKARAENNPEQMIKTFIFRMKNTTATEENAFEEKIKELEEEIKLSIFPSNAIMHSMLAEMYWMYYSANRWKFYNRTQTVGFNNDDMKTWDLSKLADRVIKHYQLSIQNSDSLQHIQVTDIDELIAKGNARNLRPTLYDFLALRAVNFFSNTELSLPKPAENFELREDFYFSDAEEFVKQKLESPDSLSLKYWASVTLQNLLKFRLADKNIEAYLEADISRLEFALKSSVNEIKDSLYFEALKKLEDKFKSNPYSNELSYLIAKYYSTRAVKYNPLQEETYMYKMDNMKALEICNNVIRNDARNFAKEKCENLKFEIEREILNFNIESSVIPNQKILVKISYKNATKVYVRISKIDLEKYQQWTEKNYGKDLITKLLKETTVAQMKVVDLPDDNDLMQHSAEILLDKLPIGNYLILISDNETFSTDKRYTAYDLFTVTNISYVQRRQEDGSYDFYVLHRQSGVALANVSAQLWYSEYNYKTQHYEKKKGAEYISNSDGYFSIPNQKNNYRNFLITFRRDNDFLSSDESYYYGYYYNKQPKNKYTYFFTDRAIYRPGQTIYFKGIVLNTDGENNDILPNQAVTVSFFDVNYQKIKDLKLTTNEYGTINGTLEIPTGVINGSMQLVADIGGSKALSVEEYKRPKFEVKMLPNNGIYRLNDSVEVKGTAKALSGANLTDAIVSYRVVRTPLWRGWWNYDHSFREVEILNGKSKTNEKGEVSVKFKAIPDLSVKKNNNIVFNYRVYVDVTDINGETQSTQGSITVGFIALSVNVDIEAELNREKTDEIKILTQNLNGEFITAKGTIKIFQLEEPKDVLRNRLWSISDKYLYTETEWKNEFPGNTYKDECSLLKLKKGDEIFNYQFDTEKDKKFSAKGILKWKPGRYVAIIKSKDQFGVDVENEKYFVLYSEKEKDMPIQNMEWFSAVNYICEPGDIAKFLIGSSGKDIKVLFETEVKGKITEKKWITLSNEQKLIEIPVIEAYRGNATVHFTYIKDSRLYSNSQAIIVPYTNKQIDIEFMTFRDKLQPGEQEEWQLKIKGTKGDKIAAEMLATLYDASLDAFKTNYWDFNIYKTYYSSLTWGANSFAASMASSFTVNTEYHSFPTISDDQLNWFGFNYYSYGLYGRNQRMSSRGEGNVKTKSAKLKGAGDKNVMAEEASPAPMAKEMEKKPSSGKMDADGIDDASVTGGESDTPGQKGQKDGISKNKREEVDLGNVKARSNFSETAFFFPDLKTNEKGEVIIKFTIPESLTRWKMMGFAHSKDLKYGFIQKELITQKELMVMPNPPRFFRENDLIEFPVKISNVSDKDLTGIAQLQFFDALTMKPLDNLFVNSNDNKPLDFKVAAGQNISLKWKLKIPEGAGAISYKIVAKAGVFSDGEENVVPVLTNRMLVTESFPLPIRGITSKTFEFTKLKNFKNSTTLKNQKLTLEFTSNPAWYAIQALPYIMEYPYECAEQVFSRFYANSLASHIANSKPKIKKVFDSWKNAPDSKALLSNLEKNQELKTLLLEETPWVLNAQDETSRKKQVGLLFDLNKMGSELTIAIKKLEDMQVSNGAWPWFKGMPESRYITQHVVTGMAHLDNLGVTKIKEDKKVWSMVEKAVNYLDYEIKKDYENLKKWYKPKELELNHLSEIQIQYLYARSYFINSIEMSASCKEAFGYYKDQSAKYWLQQSKYMQAMIGLSLFRYGNEKVPAAIVKSLKEFSITSDEMGMYWKDVEAGYYWYQAPIETQAMMIELFDVVGKDQASVNDLKVWLLKQKQTQDWKTTKATVEAVYALLLRGADWLDSDQLVQVKLGNINIDPKKMDDVKVEAGTGYYKTSWAGSEITPEMGDISITKTDEGVAWGALYWQYFEQLDKITPHETPLKLNKKLFIERDTKNGKIIELLDEKGLLKVGDKIIVRIELRVDRNMEYIHMKDMRASGFEPINVISRYKYQDGLGYYESTKDAATNFFMSYMPKGTYVFEYPLRVTHNGDFSNGITQIECMYAPEFGAHSEGIRVKVGDEK